MMMNIKSNARRSECLEEANNVIIPDRYNNTFDTSSWVLK